MELDQEEAILLFAYFLGDYFELTRNLIKLEPEGEKESEELSKPPSYAFDYSEMLKGIQEVLLVVREVNKKTDIKVLNSLMKALSQ